METITERDRERWQKQRRWHRGSVVLLIVVAVAMLGLAAMDVWVLHQHLDGGGAKGYTWHDVWEFGSRGPQVDQTYSGYHLWLNRIATNGLLHLGMAVIFVAAIVGARFRFRLDSRIWGHIEQLEARMAFREGDPPPAAK